MALTLTESAAKEMKRMLSERNKPETTLVRIGVVGGGCSGFEYQMDFADAPDEQADVVTESHGVRVAVDKKSARYLNGTQIDYQENLLKRGFVFNNPLAVKTCGCGSSFGV
jgi:iron-sulfur cluster assembly protein